MVVLRSVQVVLNTVSVALRLWNIQLWALCSKNLSHYTLSSAGIVTYRSWMVSLSSSVLYSSLFIKVTFSTPFLTLIFFLMSNGLFQYFTATTTISVFAKPTVITLKKEVWWWFRSKFSSFISHLFLESPQFSTL